MALAEASLRKAQLVEAIAEADPGRKEMGLVRWRRVDPQELPDVLAAGIRLKAAGRADD